MSGTAEKETLQQEQIALVKMENVDVINDGNLILSDVNLTIKKGEFVYLLGKVGSGKSSIIKTLIAEFPLKKGYVEVAGFKLWKIKNRHIPYLRRKLGVVFQDFQLLMDRTVEDNLLFVLEATGWKRRKEMIARSMEVLEMVGLPEKAKKMPHQLSGGEQQRVAIARALLNNPEVILADEPTGNLDEDTAAEIMTLLRRIHETRQTAVLMVTHNRELYKRFPGRVLICEEGGVREMEQEIEFELDPLAAGEVCNQMEEEENVEVCTATAADDPDGAEEVVEIEGEVEVEACTAADDQDGAEEIVEIEGEVEGEVEGEACTASDDHMSGSVDKQDCERPVFEIELEYVDE